MPAYREGRRSGAKETSRHSAAERLSTPDQLDQVIQVARFPHWLALSALSLMLAAGIAASILIPIPITVRGEGILINAGGILTVTSETEGRLLELKVTPGMTVERGQIVAHVDQPKLELALAQRREELDEALRRREKIQAFHRRTSQTQNQTIANQRRALVQRLDFAKAHLHALEEELRVDTELNRDGIISRRKLLATRTRIDAAKDQMMSTENEIKRFVQVITREELSQERELLEGQLEINDLERRIASLEQEYRRKLEVRSPYDGKVLELKINQGEITEVNGPLFSLLPTAGGAAIAEETGADELIAVIYVPPAEGKKIQPAMEVQLALSSIKREEFGFMLGRVSSVAEVPATTAGMMRILQNRQLVEQLSRDQAPFEVLVALDRDPSAYSGYRWSSSTGPAVAINVGTLCTGDVITRHERPIRILLPSIGRLFD